MPSYTDYLKLTEPILESLINITLATKVKAIIASVGIRGIRKVT
jgi:hypothetical protein